MSLLTDIKSVSDAAIEQLSGRFHDLPRPLLAAIGAGDLAVERLAALREQLSDRIATGPGTPTGDDVRAFAADLPGLAQQVAGDVARSLEEFATAAPERVQKLIGELPSRSAELSDSLSPEKIRGTVEAYTQFVAMIYGNLAERGGKALAKTGPEAAAPKTATTGAARKTATTAAARRTATATAARRTATTTAARKRAARTPATGTAATRTAATRKPAATTRRTARGTAGAANRSAGTSARSKRSPGTAQG